MKEEKIIVNLYAEWDEEKQGYCTDIDYKHYFNNEVYSTSNNFLICASASLVPIISLFELSDFDIDKKIKGQIFKVN